VIAGVFYNIVSGRSAESRVYFEFPNQPEYSSFSEGNRTKMSEGINYTSLPAKPLFAHLPGIHRKCKAGQ
jgi:hypothetical protein